ncbi:hypothetical protein Ahy_B10g100774 [Arachis hypogaea]|uniref:Replication protein A 70 kDa DNA-binding subunit B/D first OB fold domain-containing protein n=1 Tax=Arachis hypogaea TaxID=3818 RepID=A0A444WXH1_ARAHY|nr:hypothetical protein Ahy_B10g100774 [Arachis hypogaea]
MDDHHTYYLSILKFIIFEYDLIKCINDGPEHKVWKLKAPIEMVVLDEEGDTIQCSIKGIFVPIFEGLLAEGNVYMVTNFAVTLNTIKFKPTRHEFRINFKRDMIVRPVQDSSVPLNGFNFVPFKKIHAESKEDGYLVDVIGQLASKGNLVEFTRMGSRQKLRVTLWQIVAFNLLKYLEEHPCLTYVVILQMGKMKFYSRVMGVSNINYNSKLFINVEFPTAGDFFARVNKLDPIDGQGIMPLVCDQPVSIEEHFLRLSVYKTIAEIKEHNQDDVFITTGTIKEVETEFGWWYKGCKKCRRGLRELEKRYFCPKCVEDYGFYVPRLLQVKEQCVEKLIPHLIFSVYNPVKINVTFFSLSFTIIGVQKRQSSSVVISVAINLAQLYENVNLSTVKTHPPSGDTQSGQNVEPFVDDEVLNGYDDSMLDVNMEDNFIPSSETLDELTMSDDEIKQLCLMDIDKILHSYGETLKDYPPMPLATEVDRLLGKS